MHKVKQFWNRIIFREEVDPEAVFENRLSGTEVKDGYLNLSNMDIPLSYVRNELISVVMIDVDGKAEEPVTFRCRQRPAPGKKGMVFKRQRFWPVGFGLKEWFQQQEISAGDFILIAIATHSQYMIFRAFRPKTMLMLNDRRAAMRRDLERRFEERRSTLIYTSLERRKKERRSTERRNLERRSDRQE
ncbi:hypothetical protein KAR10_08705 [bacterium]|nr:hypothetical protein [bacterium]